jgi:hypothetical protein
MWTEADVNKFPALDAMLIALTVLKYMSLVPHLLQTVL